MSLPDIRQRRKPHPACPGKHRCKIPSCIHNTPVSEFPADEISADLYEASGTDGTVSPSGTSVIRGGTLELQLLDTASELGSNDDRENDAELPMATIDTNTTGTGTSSILPRNALNDGTTEHSKRLRSYIKGFMTSFVALVAAIFMSNVKEQGNPIFIKATYICLIFSFLSILVVMVLSQRIQTLSTNRFPCQYKDHLYIFVYGSTIMLMVCGLFLLLASNANYRTLAIFPILALVIMIDLFRRGCNLGHTQSATNYRDHDGKLRYFSEFSSAGTVATFVGLSTCILSSPSTSHQNGEVKPTEISLYIAVVASLLLMQLSSVPPAVSNEQMRERMIKTMRYLSNIMVGALFLVAMLATGAVLRGVTSIFIYTAITMIFAVVIARNELKVQLCVGNASIEVDVELDSLSMVVVDVTFSVLMVVYTKYVDDRIKVNGHFFLFLVCMLCSCMACVTSLIKELLVYDGNAPGAWPRAKMISSYISYAFAFVAVASALTLWRS